MSDKSFVVPRVKHFLSGVLIPNGVVAKLVCELYVWVPLLSGLRVVSEIDCSGSTAVIVDGVDHSTGSERIRLRFHVLCVIINNLIIKTVNSINKSLTTLICGFIRNLKQ